MDGVTTETGNQGGQYLQLAQDWVQEFSVLAALYPAEYGSSAGGVINTVLRSGGNQFHGRGYAFYQNAALNADPRFFTGTSKSPFISDRIGGMVGGPIRRTSYSCTGKLEQTSEQCRSSYRILQQLKQGQAATFGAAHRHRQKFACTLASARNSIKRRSAEHD